MNNTYVSIDIETTGLDPETCQILEIGAVIDNGRPLKNCPTFHCYVDNGLIQGEPYALSMHPKIFLAIANEMGLMLRPEEVAAYFLQFLCDHGLKNEPIIVAGENYAIFDARFLRRLPDWDKIKIVHRILDPAMLYWQPDIDGYNLPNLKTCKKRAGIPGEVAHTAVEDARDVVRLIRKGG